MKQFKKDRDVLIVLGKTGFGKSVFTKAITAKTARLLVFDPSAEFDVEFGDADEIAKALDGSEIEDEFRFGVWDSDEVAKLGALSFINGKNSLVIEECSAVFKKGGKLPDWAKRCIFLGRHRDVSLIFIAQRASSIPIDIRSQANWIVSFQQHEGDDVDWLKGFFGKRVEVLPYLKKLECLEYKNGNISQYSIKGFLGKGEKGVDIDSEKVYTVDKLFNF